MTLWRVTAPHFVAGFEADEDGRVVRAAPILGWLRITGRSVKHARAHCDRKGYTLERVNR